MLNFIADLSQRKTITILRFLYPIWFVVGLFSIMYVPTTLIISGDAATTARNIIAHEMLFRMGIIGNLLTQLIHIFAVLVLYKLFESVNKNHALLMVVFGLIGVPIAMLNNLNHIAALHLLNGSDFLKVLGTDQLQIQMMFFLDMNLQGQFIATIFWGLWLLPLGYLIYKSGYFPKILGVLVMMGCFGFVLDAFTHFILPDYANYQAILTPVVLLLTIGEVLFMGWVVFKGAEIPEMKS